MSNRLTLHLEQHDSWVKGYVVEQSESLRFIGLTKGWIAVKDRGSIQTIDSSSLPSLCAGILWIRGHDRSEDHHIFSQGFSSPATAAEAIRDIEELVDWINSKDFEMGGTVPLKIQYPIKAEYHVSKGEGSGCIYFHDHLGAFSYKTDQLQELLSKDFGDISGQEVITGHHKVEVILHAPEEGE